MHIETCKNMAEIRRRSANEIIPARWAADVEGEYVTALRIQVDRQKGVIAEIAATINEADAGIENIKVDERDAELSTVVGRIVGAQPHAPRARHAPAARADEHPRHQQDHRMSDAIRAP